MVIDSRPVIQRLAFDDTDLPEVVCHTLLRELPKRRQVFAAHWGDKPVIAKLYFGRRAKRHWQRELSGSRALRAAAIATPDILHSGALRDNSLVILYRALPQPVTALEAWDRCETDAERCQLLRRLLALIAATHRHGLLQTDIHLNNFLLSNKALYAIDGDGVRRYPGAIHALLYRKNLAMLLAQLPISAENLINAAVATYLENHPQPHPDFHNKLTKDLDRARRKRRLRYVAKCTRNCTEFVRRQTFRHLTIARRELAATDTLKDFLHDPDRFLGQGMLLKEGNSATVAKVMTDEGEWVIKRYNQKSLLHALKKNLKSSRALVSWRNAHRLAGSGITTPQALVLMENRVGLWKRTCYYVSRWCDASDLDQVFETFDEPKQNTAAARGLVKLLRQFHQLGIYHGDCKATNFLVTDTAEPVVIDLDAMGEGRWRFLYRRRYRRDRQRFLANWPKKSPLHHFFDQQLP